MRMSIITVSDRASEGIYEDLSGPAIESILRKCFPDARIERHLVPDKRERILEAFLAAEGADIILTSGGTGLSPRDITPEVTAAYCDREVPGIAEFLRMKSLAETDRAVLSRGYAGQKGYTLIVNVPGSRKAAEFCTNALTPLLEHAVAMMRGGGH